MEVLQESKAMIPDCKRRLLTAHEELEQLLVSLGRKDVGGLEIKMHGLML